MTIFPKFLENSDKLANLNLVSANNNVLDKLGNPEIFEKVSSYSVNRNNGKKFRNFEKSNRENEKWNRNSEKSGNFLENSSIGIFVRL